MMKAIRSYLSAAVVFATILPVFGGVRLFPSDGGQWKARPGTQIGEMENGAIAVSCDGTYGWPGVELRPKGSETWDLSRDGTLEVVVSNMGARAEQLSVDVMPKGAPREKLSARSSLVPPGAVRLISVQLADARILTDEPVKLERMRGTVGSVRETRLDYSRTVRVEVFQCQPNAKHPLKFAVLDVRTRFEAATPKVVAAADFFPFCDRYGQLKHLEWPGKIHSDEELAASLREEEEWLREQWRGPVADIDMYGGWKGGPRLKATGFFRTEKVDGRWWLVDPEGHVFFSLGVTCIYPTMDTIVDGREKYFEWLPDSLSPSWDNPKMKVVKFMELNYERKYGSAWRERFVDTAHRRLRAWGMNTLGNWTPRYVQAPRRTPYVATLDRSSGTRLKFSGKKGFGRHMPDVYSPQFAADVRAGLEKLAAQIKDDPWCIGVFVDNELAWDSPDNPGEVAEKYFSTVAAAFREVLPNHLYLGCRFAWGGEDVWRAAARYCDVVSFNFYERRPTKDLPSDAEDKPVIVGEFHFGALDRGMLNTACAATFNQDERAQCFKDYVNACLDNPRFVGCHWFQYTDQSLTGRYDGENFQCGFVSVCDVPYRELVEACRVTAAAMYRRHMAAPPPALAPVRPHPRLFADSDAFKAAKTRLNADAAGRAALARLAERAQTFMQKPLLERKMKGRRMLDVSCAALDRISTLAFLWRVTGERRYAERAADEARAVCSFADWNPSHFLDVAEMTLAVAIALDWLDDALAPADKEMLARAIVEKGLTIGDGATLQSGWWEWCDINWNQVCHGGLAAGAAAIREYRPGLAEAVLRRARLCLPLAMKAYAGGNFPEGPAYWNYATTYTAVALAVLEREFADGAGELFAADGFASQIDYLNAVTGPTGLFFNYSDCGESRRRPSAAMYYLARRFDRADALAAFETPLLLAGGDAGRFQPLLLLWGAPAAVRQARRHASSATVLGGANPIAALRAGNGRDGWYVGVKGGSASLSHAHMDAGSFVLDAGGTRWACDLGNEDYSRVESLGEIDLWNMRQDSSRWSLFRLGASGHNTITIDGARQRVDACAAVSSVSPAQGECGAVEIDLSPLYPGASRVTRRFGLSAGALSIRDAVEGARPGAIVEWGMNTTASVSSAGGGRLVLESAVEAGASPRCMTVYATCGGEPVEWKIEQLDHPRSKADSPNHGVTRISFGCAVLADGTANVSVTLRE